MVIQSWLERAAATRAEVCALRTPQREISYSELLRNARAGRAWLSGQGIAPKDKVAIALAPGLPFATALHACMLLGAVAVPVDLRLAAAEREQITSGSSILIEEPLPEEHPGTISDALAGHDLQDTAAIIHTSGTTSAPKPVKLTYGNFLWSALGSAVALGLDPNERWLCALPVSHVGGLSILMRSAIYGTTAIVHERFETDSVLSALQEEEVTLVSLVATTLARLLDAGLESPAGLRCALVGGGPVSPALLARAIAAGVPVSQTYGLTEACSQVTTTPIAKAAIERSSAGPSLFCTRVSIAQDGEILVRGPTLAQASIASDGWLHTGDLGSMDENGWLSVTGRKADTIVTGGENVAPAEVEAVLEAHPDVLEAAVVGRTDEQWGQAVTAVVVLRDGDRTTVTSEDGLLAQGTALRGENSPESYEAALRAHCAVALAPFKVPKAFMFTSEPLPRTRSGKLLRRDL